MVLLVVFLNVVQEQCVRENAVLLPDATALKRTVLVLHKAVACREVELT